MEVSQADEIITAPSVGSPLTWTSHGSVAAWGWDRYDPYEADFEHTLDSVFFSVELNSKASFVKYLHSIVVIKNGAKVPVRNPREKRT